MTNRADIDYELVISPAGSVSMTCGGEVLWLSDGDDDFAEEFEDILEFDDKAACDRVIDWLVEHEYIPPGVPVTVIEESDGWDMQ